MVFGRGFIRSSAFAGVLWLAGCAAQQVTPMAMTQPGDEQLSCAELAQQIAANRASAEEFVKKDKQVDAANVAKNVGSVIPFLGLALMASTDLSESEQVKARALVDRDERLNDLSKRKNCAGQ